MELPGTNVVLTSDSFFYLAGQVFLWAVIAFGVIGLFTARLERRQQIALGVALVFAFISSLGPLFLRWVLSMPGLGGPDAGGEEFWLSLSTTFPQAVAFALLLWIAFKRPELAKIRTDHTG